MGRKQVCIVLSFDANFYYQAKECIKTIRKHCLYEIDICVLGIRLSMDQKAWLIKQGVILQENYSLLPKYKKEFPVYGYAQICRPFLKDLFPGYEIYMWVDADIRFTMTEAFDIYFGSVLSNKNSIAICQEVDNLYGIIKNPRLAFGYHTMINERIRKVYGEEVYEKTKYYYHFNSGVWAMHADSNFWFHWKSEFQHALSHDFNHMREQDALNVAILKYEISPVYLPSTMNWLCALAIPKFDKRQNIFIRPEYPHTPICVLHLIASESEIVVQGQKMKWYDFYKKMNFTD